ncbi:MAG TPA: quinohemoprotein amine dehydrogenase subunit alpha [Gemmatimonadaceae bacterium]|nr:quinohemoprotein amine dehydrogenase subunit alpha [Gemmatimonadaceae bacterium]
MSPCTATRTFFGALALAFWADLGRAQPPRDTTTGFAIKHEATIARCARCHKRDSTGMMSRLSYMRKTPEGWETSLRRMVTLNDVRVDPAEAREIVKYLSNNQGLAPEELRAGRFESERRMIDHRYTADTRTETVCKACHSLGRVITQRRTREEWELVVATHRGYYPVADFQGFRRFGPPPPDSAGQPHPMDQAISHLARAFPLRTPEWTAWSATMRPPPIVGTWLLSGTQPGRGDFVGRLTITKAGADDEFATTASYRFVSGGGSVTRQGRSVVYTGHQWRGRSTEAGKPADSVWREVIFIEPGWQEMSGRWFNGGYDENGIDVKLTRLSGSPAVAGIIPRGLRKGGTAQDITIVGANLPPNVSSGQIDFGPGVRIERVLRSSAEEVHVRVVVDTTAVIGERDVFVAGAALPKGAAVYDKVSRIKVTPLAAMARVGGIRFPKQYAQFDAIAYNDGADGRPDTPDDLALGRVEAQWSLEEYGVTYDDDDLKWVGTIDARGFFTPNVDGPNPQRSGQRNNIGDVWVVATYRTPGGANEARPIRGRAHLLVTVPLYMRWDPWAPGAARATGTTQ